MTSALQSCLRIILLPILLFGLTTGCRKKDDNDAGPARGGMGGSASVICESDAECDDGIYCNGVESCTAEACSSGRPIICEDALECTIDLCDEETEQCTFLAPDADFDGFKDSSCVDESGAALGDDCDDSDPLVSPANVEICDQENRDEDCNPATIGQLDEDRDTYNSNNCCNPQENGELLCGEDCDDKKTNVNPRATEACDFLDNNCNGETDEGVSILAMGDNDHDGRGDESSEKVSTCPGAVGITEVGGDCDDNDPEIFTGQFEICDDKDNNCNGEVDEVRESAPWYADEDSDGFGDPESIPVYSCYPIAGRVLSQNDCNDQASLVNPGEAEVCDGLDNDCDGLANFKIPGTTNDFEDDDLDGVADTACGGLDCNDEDARTAGGAEEVCDRVDNDCDGEVDEQTVQNIWYTDQDGDGWGVVLGSAVASCDPVAGRATKFGDCDDTDQSVRPGVVEACDGIDQDCDGVIDEGASAFCNLANAISTCSFGNCRIYSCTPGFKDANLDSSDGCEAVRPLSEIETEIDCTTDADCNDNLFCNGIETCDEARSKCRNGTPVNCSGSPGIIQGDVNINGGQDLLALAGIEFITGNVFINDSSLTSLIGLESLNIIGGNLIIQNNDNLGRLSGSALSNLQTVAGKIEISGNEGLFNIDLPSLLSAGAIIIESNPNLITVSGYESLTNVEGGLFIRNNEQLTTIEGFENLVRIGSSFSPGGEEDETNNGGTSDADGDDDGDDDDDGTGGAGGGVNFVENGTDACRAGGLHIENLQNLGAISGFSALQTVEGDLCLRDIPTLEILSMPSLIDVGMNLVIENNQALSDLDLPLLGQVLQDIEILQFDGQPNNSLSELDLPNLTLAGGFRLSGDFQNLNTLTLNQLTDVGLLMVSIELMTNNALYTIEFDRLARAATIDIATSSPAGLPALLFPLLTTVEEGMSIATLAGQGLAGPLGTLALPEVTSIGEGPELLADSDPTQHGGSPQNPPLNGFRFNAKTGEDSIISLPSLQIATTIDIQLEGGSNNSEQKLESLDISSSLPTGQSLAISELRLNGNMETVQLDKVDEVDDLLSICINTLSPVSLCPIYTRILNASSSAYDQTSDDCPALCGSTGDLTNIPAIDLSDEAVF